MSENKEKIDAGLAGDVESALKDLKKSIEDNKADEMKSGMEKVTSLSHKLAEAMYKTEAETANSEAPEGGSPEEESKEDKKDDDVLDAEFEEAKD